MRGLRAPTRLRRRCHNPGPFPSPPPHSPAAPPRDTPGCGVVYSVPYHPYYLRLIPMHHGSYMVRFS